MSPDDDDAASVEFSRGAPVFRVLMDDVANGTGCNVETMNGANLVLNISGITACGKATLTSENDSAHVLPFEHDSINPMKQV